MPVNFHDIFGTRSLATSCLQCAIPRNGEQFYDASADKKHAPVNYGRGEINEIVVAIIRLRPNQPGLQDVSAGNRHIFRLLLSRTDRFSDEPATPVRVSLLRFILTRPTMLKEPKLAVRGNLVTVGRTRDNPNSTERNFEIETIGSDHPGITRNRSTLG